MSILDDVVSTGEGLVSQFSGKAGAEAAQQAAALQAAAGEKGITAIEAGTAAGQAQLDPFAAGGGAAFQQQQAMLGLLGPEAQQQAMQTIQESPGQKFIRERSQRNLLRNQAAIGGLGGGNVRTALAEQGAGFAAQDIENQFSRLMGLTQVGAGAAGQGAALQVAGGGNIAQALGGTAAAQASGILGAQQARQQGLQNIIQAGGAIAASDENMKENIQDLDLKECFDNVMALPLKSWKYLLETGLDQDINFGPMYQASPEMIKEPGMKALNIHNEIMMIAGAMQYMKNEGMLCR